MCLSIGGIAENTMSKPISIGPDIGFKKPELGFVENTFRRFEMLSYRVVAEMKPLPLQGALQFACRVAAARRVMVSIQRHSDDEREKRFALFGFNVILQIFLQLF
jgi:hypothetical protein